MFAIAKPAPFARNGLSETRDRRDIARLPKAARKAARRAAALTANGLPPDGGEITISAGGYPSELTRFAREISRARAAKWTGTIRMLSWPFNRVDLALGNEVDQGSVFDHEHEAGGRKFPWERTVCPNCGADGIVRLAQDAPIRYPETAEAPCFCQVCGWEGTAGETAKSE